MKKAFGIALGGIIFLVLLILILFRVFNPRETEDAPAGTDPFRDIPVTVTPQTTSTPELAAQSCYAWYLQRFAVNSDVIAEQNTDPMVRTCFTPTLLESWSTIIDETNADPLLQSQDYYPSWLSSVQSQPLSQLSQSATVLVILGTGEEVQQLAVSLLRIGSEWKIDSVRAQ